MEAGWCRCGCGGAFGRRWRGDGAPRGGGRAERDGRRRARQLRAHLPGAADRLRGQNETVRERAEGARQAGRDARCERRSEQRAGVVDHRPGSERKQPEQSERIRQGRRSSASSSTTTSHLIRRRAWDSPTDPEDARRTRRTPSLDLDSVYGEGPVASPQLYDPADRDKLRVELRRASSRTCPARMTGLDTAILPDPRNDENLIIAGLQCAFIQFHNNAVDWARRARLRRRARRSRKRTQADDLALPVAGGARVPAADRRPGDGRRCPQEPPPLLQAAHASRASSRSSSRRLHTGSVTHGAPVLPCEPARRRRRAVLRNGLRSRRRGPVGSHRPARGGPRAAALHRLADLLRLRRRAT